MKSYPATLNRINPIHNRCLTLNAAPKHPGSPARHSSRITGTFALLAGVCWLVAGAQLGSAANIVWVSDVNDPFVGFFPAGSGFSDQGFVTLLQNAGHNVIRFNGPNSQNTLLTQADLDALNTNDLIIIGRAAGSGAWRPPQVTQWNTLITKPLICMSPYLTRTLAGAEARMGWFTAGTLPDDVPTVLSAVDPADPATDYLFGGVTMLGTNTVSLYDELLDRNTSHTTDPPVTGGRVLAGATFPRENDGVVVTANAIADFPAGTVVQNGLDVLAGYRMFFAGGSRESATAPANNIPLYTGRETLTPTGESIFLRAVELAINSGAAPPSDPQAPIGFTTQPTSATVLQNLPVTFSVSVTGAAPRTLQWQRDTGDGVTFTNIPDAVTTFLNSSFTITNVALEDDNARFRVEASNPLGTVHSDVVTLTVTADAAAPVPLSAASADGVTIGVCFNELLDNRPLPNGTAVEPLNYLVDDGAVITTGVALRPDGRSVLLTLSGPLAGATFKLDVLFVEDRFTNSNPSTLTGTNHGLTSIAVGAVNPPGSSFSCTSNSFEISGGGLQLASTSDIFQFAYKTMTGDFDARVRVAALVGSDRLESTAIAMLTARASTDANAAAVNVFVTPLPAADNSMRSTVRTATGAATNEVGTVVIPSGMPNAWMRITRAGNLFTTYRGTDGVNWTEFGAVTVNLGPSAVVGLGVNSHRNGRIATGTFTDFSVTQAPASPTIVNASHNGTAFSASFQTQSGVSYEVQYNSDLNNTTWTTLTTITGDGALQSFTDSSPAPTQRFYRVAAQ